MIYEYKCEKCKKITELEMRMIDDQPNKIECSFCKKDAYRYFHVTPIIPLHMRAGEEGFNYEKVSRHNRKYH